MPLLGAGLRAPARAPGRTSEDGLSGAGGTAPAPGRRRPSPGRGRGDTVRAWSELFRISALFSVPGDALAGAAAVGRGPGRGTALAVGASLCLYEAGMALNDWADREEDAVDRPHRPIPSGRVSPAAALSAAGLLTAAGLALAARAGRPALAVATGLAATVWAYDLRLKHTKAGPAAMAAARSLDLLLGATATATAAGGGAAATARGGADNVAARVAFVRGPLPAALVLGAHTYGVTAVSRHEAQGGSTAVPLAVLATTAVLGTAVLMADRAGRPGTPGEHGAARTQGPGERGPVRAELPGEHRPVRAQGPGAHRAVQAGGARERLPVPTRGPEAHRAVPAHGPGGHGPARPHHLTPADLLLTAFTGAYLRTAGPPLLHAALNPSPPLTQRAVGGGIRAMIPLQAALAARNGAPGSGLAVMALVPLARALARKVSPT
ncbi:MULTISPECIES: SCO3242 family prenyltransferase [unclassified Streptomyces]|uniref:SCO3242 family prenyltransferase n=1 Tax=Streptomyces sp. SID8356 TaxID=2690340 RepID=UPI001EEFEC8A|nr:MULTISPECIES: UbiA family prenyltransferase [unclassified Streptomyces]